MIRVAPSPCTDCLNRIKSWLSAEVVADPKRRTAVALAAKVNEKTLRLSAEDAWNPTIKTLAKLEAIIPRDWQPPRNGKKARAS